MSVSEKVERERRAAIRADRALFDSLGIPGVKGRREGLAEAATRAAGARARAWRPRGSLWMPNQGGAA